MMQAWLVKGGQSKYSGHCCSFINDITKIVQRVPTLPEDLDIAIVRAKSIDNAHQPLLASNSSFHVKRERLIDNLCVLCRFHPWFQTPGRVDWNILNSLPEDGTVFHRLRSIQQTEAESVSDNLGPGDLNEDDDPALNVTSNGFVPSLHSDESEISALQNGLQIGTETILTMPTIQSTPINEHNKTRQYIILAFPSLFPIGRADFHEDRDHPVNAQDYFKHLMRYHDGRFAQHPHFRYFAWNSILRWDGKKRSRIYAKRNSNDGVMTVGSISMKLFSYSIGDLRDLLAGDVTQLAARVARFGDQLRGTRPYWQA